MNILAGCQLWNRKPIAIPQVPGEYTLEVSFRLRSATRYAPAGHEVAFEQTVIEVPGAVAPARGCRSRRPALPFAPSVAIRPTIKRHGLGQQLSERFADRML